jgi:biotin carboxylase
VTKRVLVVGARAASLTALRKEGASITCVVPASSAKAAIAAGAQRTVHVEDITSVEEVVCAASAESMTYGAFDAICSGSEFPLLAAAFAREALGTAGLTGTTALALRDKYTQKALVRRAGIAVANTTIVEGEAPDALEFPAVVKPIAGGGTAHTYLVEDLAALSFRVASGGRWLVESFVIGQEHQVDGIVRDGKIEFVSVSRYLNNLLGVHDGEQVGAVVLRPHDQSELYASALELCEHALRALGHSNGAFHLEAFLHEGKLTFSECAGRISGGSADVAIRFASGVDMHREWARAVLGLPQHKYATWSTSTFGDVQLTLGPGRILELPEESVIREQPGVRDVLFHVAAGDIMPDSTGASDVRAATVVVEGASEAEVRLRMIALQRWFSGASQTSIESTSR